MGDSLLMDVTETLDNSNNAKLKVLGCVDLKGNLTVLARRSQVLLGNLTLIEANCFSGTFTP